MTFFLNSMFSDEKKGRWESGLELGHSFHSHLDHQPPSFHLLFRNATHQVQSSLHHQFHSIRSCDFFSSHAGDQFEHSPLDLGRDFYSDLHRVIFPPDQESYFGQKDALRRGGEFKYFWIFWKLVTKSFVYAFFVAALRITKIEKNVFIHVLLWLDAFLRSALPHGDRHLFECISVWLFVAAVPQLFLYTQLCRTKTHLCGSAAK